MFPCATAIRCGDERWMIPMAFVFFPAYIQSNLCTLCALILSETLALYKSFTYLLSCFVSSAW